MTALVIGLIAFALLTSARRGPYSASELPPDQLALFNVVNGQLHYKAEVAEMVIASMLSRVAFPTDTPNLVVVQPGDKPIMGADEWGAYWVLMSLHQEGNNVWVQPTAHIPTGQPLPVLFLPPGETPPGKGYALLIAASQPWPQLPAAMA